MFFFTPGALKDTLPAIELITRVPGRALARTALWVNGILLTFSLILFSRGARPFTLVIFTAACLGLLSTLAFTWRRKRLQNAVEKWEKEQKTTIDGEGVSKPADYSDHYTGIPSSPSQEIVIIDENGSYTSSSAHDTTDPRFSDQAPREDRLREAASESRRRRNTWMPGVEAAQRSAIAAAGGLVNAPYLKDDLRVTILASIVTFLSVPLNSFFSFIAFFTLL